MQEGFQPLVCFNTDGVLILVIYGGFVDNSSKRGIIVLVGYLYTPQTVHIALDLVAQSFAIAQDQDTLTMFICPRQQCLQNKIGLAGVRARIKHHDSMPVLVILTNKICDVLFCRLWSCPGGFRFFLRHNGIKLFVGLLFLFARGLNTIQNLLQFLLSFFFRQRGRVNVLLLLILPLCLSQLQVETIEWPALLFITHVDPRLLF